MHNMSNNPRANGTTSQACAACKYQRRKCAPDCILAPYFPHDRDRQFRNAHKLFGVRNIIKIVSHLNQPEKDEAMRTIIFQSDVRANDPVGGCCRIIRELQRLIEYNKAELDLVLHQLAICRAQTQQQQQQMLMATDAKDSNLNCDITIVDPLSSYNPVNYHHLQPHQEQYHQVQPHQDQDIVNNDHVSLHEISSWAMQEPTYLQVNQPSLNECEDMKGILDIQGNPDELKFEPGEIIEPSEEAISNENKAAFKEDDDSYQHAQDHDLHGAATLFTLTNCNS